MPRNLHIKLIIINMYIFAEIYLTDQRFIVLTVNNVTSTWLGYGLTVKPNILAVQLKW